MFDTPILNAAVFDYNKFQYIRILGSLREGTKFPRAYLQPFTSMVCSQQIDFEYLITLHVYKDQIVKETKPGCPGMMRPPRLCSNLHLSLIRLQNHCDFAAKNQ